MNCLRLSAVQILSELFTFEKYILEDSMEVFRMYSPAASGNQNKKIIFSKLSISKLFVYLFVYFCFYLFKITLIRK